jgi:hypothetical protein
MFSIGTDQYNCVIASACLLSSRTAVLRIEDPTLHEFHIDCFDFPIVSSLLQQLLQGAPIELDVVRWRGKKVRRTVYHPSYFDSASCELISFHGEPGALSSGISHALFALSELEISASQRNLLGMSVESSKEQIAVMRFFTLMKLNPAVIQIELLLPSFYI